MSVFRGTSNPFIWTSIQQIHCLLADFAELLAVCHRLVQHLENQSCEAQQSPSNIVTIFSLFFSQQLTVIIFTLINIFLILWLLDNVIYYCISKTQLKNTDASHFLLKRKPQMKLRAQQKKRGSWRLQKLTTQCQLFLARHQCHWHCSWLWEEMKAQGGNSSACYSTARKQESRQPV